MADVEVAYTFYADTYGGALEEDGFKASLPHALAEVRRRTWPNDPSRDLTAYMRAVCAATDVDAAYGSTGGAGALSSITTGTVSMSFGASGSEASYDADVSRAVEGELVGTGLLFMGVG